VTGADHNRVLAIMAKAPRVGHVKTRLAPAYPFDMILELYRTLVEDSVALARQVAVNVAVVCPAEDAAEIADWLPGEVRPIPQRGRGLAAGLTSCFEVLCAGSRRPVLALDGDSPHVAPAVLESAFAALEEHDVVVGPCEDGGYYLVGATRSHPGLFTRDAMGTESACQALLTAARSLGLSSAIASTQYDVDVPSDLARLAEELASDPERAPRTAALLAAWAVGPNGLAAGRRVP
jgi:rSAM/selenodomain-associated transferase 1